MAESMTYDSLVQDVIDYCERSDEPFINQVPRFIMLAENRMAVGVRGLGYVRIVSTNLILNNPELIKPARWRETAGMYIVTANGIKFLKQRGLTYLGEYWPNLTASAEPVYYSDFSYEHWAFAPVPDAPYPTVIAYFERPTPLSSSDQTNWGTQYFPQGLFYATMIEANTFLKRPERAAEFKGLYDQAVADYQNEVNRRLIGDQVLMRNSA